MRADDDVPRAQLLDVRQRLALVALADGDAGDHRRHADDDAQRGEDRPQLVQHEVGQAQAECFEQKMHES
ncbi:hypothetical protein D3C83_174180 [compost metagenome]